jgi:hypothetical protein
MAVENLATGHFIEVLQRFLGFPLARGKALAGVPTAPISARSNPVDDRNGWSRGAVFHQPETIKGKGTMQLTAIGLATALALTGTTAFAMGGGGAGASGGVGSSYTSTPAECGGLVCFAKSPSALTAPDPRDRCASRSCRRAHPHSGRASIRQRLRDRGGG